MEKVFKTMRGEIERISLEKSNEECDSALLLLLFKGEKSIHYLLVPSLINTVPLMLALPGDILELQCKENQHKQLVLHVFSNETLSSRLNLASK